MTRQERRKPDIINGSRRKRIARGSGTTVSQVNKLLKQYRDMRRMMSEINAAGGLQEFGKNMLGRAIGPEEPQRTRRAWCAARHH